MSELLESSAPTPDVVDEPDNTARSAVAPAPVRATDESVLITEQQVLFATAAALPLQPVKTRGWFSRVVGSIVGAASATSDEDERPRPRHYPSRNDFLESSRMAREMHRL